MIPTTGYHKRKRMTTSPRDGALEYISSPRKGYRIVKNIGTGAFSTVFTVLDPQDGILVLKRTRKNLLTPRQILLSESEAIIAVKVAHPNIIKIYETFQDESFVYIVMTYAEGGDMLEYMRMHTILSEKRANLFFRQLVTAVAYAHSLGYIHRDIKLENILLDKEQTHILLGDWGFAGSWKLG